MVIVLRATVARAAPPTPTTLSTAPAAGAVKAAVKAAATAVAVAVVGDAVTPMVVPVAGNTIAMTPLAAGMSVLLLLLFLYPQPLPTHYQPTPPTTRHSQETEKKHGAGKGNWGSTEDEVQLYVIHPIHHRHHFLGLLALFGFVGAHVSTLYTCYIHLVMHHPPQGGC